MKTADTASIDRFSFHLGMINCFAEMVACGVKKLAISPPLSPGDYKRIEPFSQRIVKEFGIESHLEKSLMTTALQSPEFTRGKWSILYYLHEETLTAYKRLKERQQQLITADRYDAAARRELSTAFMGLLGYPQTIVEAKLNGRHPDPFILTDN